MLELAQVKKGDVVYDLGSGDGRIVVTAAKKYGVKAIGFEIDPERIKESAENIKKAGVGDLVEIRQQDIRTVDLSPATVLTMYLLPEVNLMIRPNIWKQMKPGSRVVSHDFDMGDWKPLKTEHIKDGSSWDHTLYLWHVEARQEIKAARKQKGNMNALIGASSKNIGEVRRLGSCSVHFLIRKYWLPDAPRSGAKIDDLISPV